MTYPEAIEFLYGLRLFGAKFGLDNTLKLAALAGNPHHQLRFIHVAGTNGKGSTCAMLDSIYRMTGLRTGLFTSPHLVSFAERIQVNRQPIRPADVVRFVQTLQPWIHQFPADLHPTFFEAVTILALVYFAEQNCDLVLWETGLGGRLDSTNIVTPLASVITNIGIEHAEYLGDTFEKIAAEKAGIIKPGIPVVTAARPGEGREIIAAVARQNNAPLTIVDIAQTNRTPLDSIELPLHGPHQKQNAATALAVVDALAGKIPVDESDLRRGLASVHWPGRMQFVRTASGQNLLLDGAHNPAGAQALRVALEAEFPTAKPTLVFGVFRDKDSSSMCHALAPIAGRILLTPVHADRSENPAALVPACREVNPHAPIETCSSLAEALSSTANDPFIVIAGSLYLVGEAMELLHLTPPTPNDEKRLNDWTANGPRRAP